MVKKAKKSLIKRGVDTVFNFFKKKPKKVPNNKLKPRNLEQKKILDNRKNKTNTQVVKKNNTNVKKQSTELKKEKNK